jgi:hypothetical protein
MMAIQERSTAVLKSHDKSHDGRRGQNMQGDQKLFKEEDFLIENCM